MFKRIDVVVLFAADLDRARTFYRDTIGLVVQFEDESSAAFQLENAMLILLSTAGAQDLLSPEAVAVPPSAGAGAVHVAFVDDVDATYEALSAKGVEFVRKPEDRVWGMRTAHFKDPDGNIWEISRQITEESPE